MSSPAIDPTADPTLPSVTAAEGLSIAQLLSLNGTPSSEAQGVALEAFDTSLGVWQYRLAGSSVWLTVNTSLVNSSTNTLALLLGADDALRLIPFGPLHGVAQTGLSLRTWDGSGATAGAYALSDENSDAFGSDLSTLTLSASGVNEAPSFAPLSGTGRRITTLSTAADEAYGVIVQPDGKIVVAGWAYNGRNDDFAVTRLNTDGSMDTSFDGDGRLLLPIGTGIDKARSIVAQPDGKLLIAGWAYGSLTYDFAIARLNADGSLDTSFDTDGKRILPIGTGLDEAYTVLVQTDGKIVLVGRTANGSNNDFAIARLNANGSLDTSFDTDGKLSLPIGAGTDEAFAAALQADGKIVLVGRAWNGANDDFAVARLNVDGSLDTSFDTDGKRLIPIGTAAEEANSVIIQPDGKILIAGWTSTGTNYDFALVRLNADGSLDTTFDGDGRRVLPIGTSRDEARCIAMQDDGKILIAGRAWNGANYDFAIARLNVDGSLDTSFDGDGKRMLPVATSWDEANSITVQTDGKILVAGRTWNGANYDFAVIRLNPDGSLDNAFAGTATHTLGGTVAFTENAAPVGLDTSVSIFDRDLAALADWAGDYGGASLTLSRQGGASGDDVFSGRGALTLTDTSALLGGVVVGTVSQIDGVLSLVFAPGTTQAQVDAILSSIAYANLSDTPPASVTLQWTFSDGNEGDQGSGGALNATGLTTVTIAAVNDLPEGSVVIQGLPQQDETLTVDVSGLSDPEGLGDFSFEWQADGEQIAGATGESYTLTQDEVGKAITVVVRYTDGGGVQETVISTPSEVVADVNDAPVGSVSITGTAAQNEVLRAETQDLTDADGILSYSYQWQADGVDIEGATASTFRPGQTHVGQTISVVVSYLDGFGLTESLVSDPTDPIAEVNDAPTGSVVLMGTALEGETLVVNTDELEDAEGLGAFSYQWQADGVDIEGATDTSLTLSQAHVGKKITVVVSYTDGFDTDESVSSDEIGPVANLNAAPTGSVLILGTAAQHETLSLDASAIEDTDGLGEFSYQWQADGVDIQGATGTTLVLSQDQVGCEISVVVSYTDAEGNQESVQSMPSAPVADVNDAPLGQVIVLGMAAEGAILSASMAALTDADGLGEFSYQWQADGVDIEGATGETFELAQAHVGKLMSVLVRYTDDCDNEESVVSTSTDPVQNVNDAPVGPVVVTGVAAQYEILSADASELEDEDGLGTLSYQWKANGEDIEGACASTLTLAQAHVGKAITVTVSYVDAFGHAEAVSSAATEPVAEVNDAPTGSVLLVGQAHQHQTLTIDTTSLADAEGLGEFSYQWLADGNEIAGATGSSFHLAQEHVGQSIAVVVSYTDGFGTLESIASEPTEPVVNVNDAPVLVEPLPDVEVLEDEFFSLTVPVSTFSDMDPDDVLSITASIQDGAALPTWLSFDADTMTFTGTPGNAQVGDLRLQFRATDLAGASAYSNFRLGVLNVNDAPTLRMALADYSATTGAAFQATIPATAFVDIDAQDQLSYALVMADGSELPAWLSFNPVTRQISGTPGAQDAGELTLQIVATDLAGESASDEFSLTVILHTGELIVGTAGSDSLTGGVGHDTINGLLGNDTLVGDVGNDLLSGGSGNDSLWGGDGNDTLDGGSGSDRMTGGRGDDVYTVDGIGDVVTELVDAGFDTVRTTRTTYTLPTHVEALAYTGSSAFNGTGNAAANIISGGGSSDRLIGLAGDDTLIGGMGNDSLTGGAGADVLTGGGGNDRFIFSTPADSGLEANTRDRITDFVRGNDRIDVSAIDANIVAVSNQAFLWRGVDAFSGIAQLRMRFDAELQQTIVEGNTDANTGTVEFSIAIDGDHTTGTHMLRGADFLL